MSGQINQIEQLKAEKEEAIKRLRIQEAANEHFLSVEKEDKRKIKALEAEISDLKKKNQRLETEASGIRPEHTEANATRNSLRQLLAKSNVILSAIEGLKPTQMDNTKDLITALIQELKWKVRSKTNDDALLSGSLLLWNLIGLEDDSSDCVLCRRVLDANGYELFLECLSWDTPKESGGLFYNITGVLHSIVEVPNLRANFLKREFIEKIILLLKFENDDGFEISFSSVGILLNLLWEENWAAAGFPRESIKTHIIRTIKSWKPDIKMVVEYHNLRTFSKFLPNFDLQVGQHWALWALANLTAENDKDVNNKSVEYNRELVEGYRRMVHEANIMEQIEFLATNKDEPELNRLAKIVLKNVNNRRNIGQKRGGQSEKQGSQRMEKRIRK